MSSSSSSSSSSMGFPIVIISVIGILGTASFLLIYYVFIIKCCLNIHVSEPILRRLPRSRRRLRPYFSNAAAEPVRRGGLDHAAICAIPTFRYSSAGSPPAFECAVCLLEFREGERLRRLAGCTHGFHVDCIDAWLESNASCPLCRAEVRKEAAEERAVIDMGGKWEGKAGSMGDECVEVGRGRDEWLVVQAMRRSASMDSTSGERKEVELRGNPELLLREEGRGQRLFVAFGGWWSGRSSRRAVQPVEMGV